ncbi:MAG: HemK/PrmC family methyltransferase, partial [Prevotella sp.]|nr:HemK/PrmC family methyltransferase [Prevotella sp.]
MTYNELCRRLSPLYGEGEARAIVRMVVEDEFGLSPTDIYMGKVNQLSADERANLEEIVARIANYEPVQYVLGHADFSGRRFAVAPGVLIPRPETALLIPMIGSAAARPFTLLDSGTGSGCIAITAALDYPDATVTAWDISDDALRIARANATRLGAQVCFERQDALAPPADTALWDVIVSNPPYICMSERAEMSPHVLDHEPATALFVPDSDPLLFYRATARYA